MQISVGVKFLLATASDGNVNVRKKLKSSQTPTECRTNFSDFPPMEMFAVLNSISYTYFSINACASVPYNWYINNVIRQPEKCVSNEICVRRLN